MAKKSRKQKKSPRRRRVGAIGGDAMKLILGAAVGGLAGNILANKVGASVDEKIKGGAMLVVGYMASKSSGAMVKGLGIGLAAAGGIKLGASLLPASVMSGIEDAGGRLLGFDNYPNDPPRNVITGFNDFPNNPPANVISGINPGLELAAGAGLMG